MKNYGNKNNSYLKINHIKYQAEILEELKTNTIENELINLDTTNLVVNSFSEIPKTLDISIVLKIPYNYFRNIIKSRLTGNQIIFKIECTIYYEIYLKTTNGLILQDFGENSTFLHDTNSKYRIKPIEDELVKIIKQNKYTDILHIEIPIQNDKLLSDLLNKTLNELKFASDGLIKGNYETLLIHSRNAVIIHLTKLVDNKNSNYKKRILKEEIVNDCLKATPENLKRFYKDILTQVEKLLASIVQLLSKFIHEETGKILMRPVNEDMELIFFSLCLICKYLINISYIS